MTSKKTTDAGGREDDIDARVEKLKQKTAALNEGQMRTWTAAGCPPELEEQFWNDVLAFESAAEERPFEVLVRSGLALSPPDELDDVQITAKLWEVIDGLASLQIYLLFTDHLSDRELYARLWTEVLREPVALPPEDSNSSWHIDLSVGADDDGIETYLKYFADEEDRRSWLQEWPDDPLPDAVSPPFDRDRHLPGTGS